MKKPACLLLFVLIALPASAQVGSQQFGFLVGGSSRLYSSRDKAKANEYCHQLNPPQPDNCVGFPSSNWSFHDRDFELFYAVALEDNTHFKIRAGQINSGVGVIEAVPKFVPPVKGHIEHVDGIVQYDFSEPFGRTGIFAGLGMYRWSGNGVPSETNYGYTLGVNADFPITRRYGVVVEGSYYWLNMSSPVRYMTLTGGLRVGF